jgi:hypothetical protein
VLCFLSISSTSSSFNPAVIRQTMERTSNSELTESLGDGNPAKRPSVYSSASSSGSASGSGSTSVTLPPMSLGALLNTSTEKEKEMENGIVKMLSLNTQASHANLRPVPLISSYRSPSAEGSSGSTPSQPRPQGNGPIETRKRGREEDEEEIQYLGRTPSTWKKWEAAGGVRSENGSPYCYAYDDDGHRKSPVPASDGKLIGRIQAGIIICFHDSIGDSRIAEKEAITCFCKFSLANNRFYRWSI